MTDMTKIKEIDIEEDMTSSSSGRSPGSGISAGQLAMEERKEIPEMNTYAVLIFEKHRIFFDRRDLK